MTVDLTYSMLNLSL